MTLKVHDLVVLLEELPAQKLRRGDVGSIFRVNLPDDRCEVSFGASHERGMIDVILEPDVLLRLNQAYHEELSPFAPLAFHRDDQEHRLEEIQAAQTECDIHIPPALSLHDRLHLVCIHRPTDFAPYGIRLRHSADCSCGCKHYVLLEGKEGADWGMCTNSRSPRAGLLTFEHQGCEFFEFDPMNIWTRVRFYMRPITLREKSTLYPTQCELNHSLSQNDRHRCNSPSTQPIRQRDPA